MKSKTLIEKEELLFRYSTYPQGCDVSVKAIPTKDVREAVRELMKKVMDEVKV